MNSTQAWDVCLNHVRKHATTNTQLLELMAQKLEVRDGRPSRTITNTRLTRPCTGRHVRHMHDWAVPETWTKALSSTGAENESCPGLSFSVTQNNAGMTIAGKCTKAYFLW